MSKSEGGAVVDYMALLDRMLGADPRREARWKQEALVNERHAEDRARAADARDHAARCIPARLDAALKSPLKDTQPLTAVRQWLEDGASAMLVMSGTKGCGKSVAAAWAIANGRSGARFVRVSELARVSVYREDEIGPFERAPLLAIDDLGTEYADKNGMFLTLLDGLLDARYAEMRPTIITTNLAMPAFCSRYGERVADRIRDGKFVQCTAASLRGSTA